VSWVVFSVFLIDVLLQFVFRSKGVGVENTGISFGVYKSIDWLFLAFVLVLFFLWMRGDKKIKNSLGLSMVLFGGLGNLIGRFATGGVWDYISLPLVPFLFNLSDTLISFGVISYILGDKWK